MGDSDPLLSHQSPERHPADRVRTPAPSSGQEAVAFCSSNPRSIGSQPGFWAASLSSGLQWTPHSPWRTSRDLSPRHSLPPDQTSTGARGRAGGRAIYTCWSQRPRAPGGPGSLLCRHPPSLLASIYHQVPKPVPSPTVWLRWHGTCFSAPQCTSVESMLSLLSPASSPPALGEHF